LFIVIICYIIFSNRIKFLAIVLYFILYNSKIRAVMLDKQFTSAMIITTLAALSTSIGGAIGLFLLA
jgi:uncharacterized membrane protein